MFVPLSKMPPQLQAHLRYPPDIFSVQSAVYGRYHLTDPGQFYAASNAWQLSPTAGAGPQSQALLAENTYNSQGQLVSTTPARMSPQYQVYSLPGTDPGHQVFTVSDGFVPASQTSLSGGQNFNLTAWMVGQSDPGHYGQLDLYDTPQGTIGPANADAEISAYGPVSSDITLLNQHGSQVLLGETMMLPVANSMVYLRPLYVAATTNPQPQLAYVIAVLGKTVKIDQTVPMVLTDLFNATVVAPTGSGSSSTATIPAAVAQILQQAQTDYNNAKAALAAGDLAGYQSAINAMDQQLNQAQQVLGAASATTGSTTTTTTTLPRVHPGRSASGSGSGSGATTSTSSPPGGSTTSTTAPASTEPQGGSTTTSTTSPVASAAPSRG
jgi:uncharacterized membrane protein (UPF0182 family)